MYLRDIPRLPKAIDRTPFISYLFEIGETFGCDTLMIATEIADTFIQQGPVEICTWCHRGSTDDFMNQPISPYYSNELAHVCLVIACKFNEDSHYNQTLMAAVDTENGIVYKMEWEILLSLDFRIPRHNFISFIAGFSLPNPLHSMFYELAYQLCLNPDLLHRNPFTLLLGIKILYQRSRLKADHINRRLKFGALINHLADEYEIELPLVIKACLQ